MASVVSRKLGKRIKELRTAKGLKQREIADFLDMERSNYTRIESGKQSPSDRNLAKIADYLGGEIKDLFDYEHICTREELTNSIINILPELSDKELVYCYKMLSGLKQMR